jgi:dUTP pyrophosphatase
MKVKIKKLHKDAIIPKYAKPGDAALDLTAIDYEIEGNIITYDTGLAIEIPEGHVGLLFPRSSVFKKDLIMANSVGVIDSQYRGSIMFKYRSTAKDYYFEKVFDENERIGQIMIIPYPQIEFEEVDELSSTDRGTGGFGSTGS